jgi:pimeloyl-ACP methyl ester carboxylesterase
MKKFLIGVVIIVVLLALLALGGVTFIQWRLLPNGSFSEATAPEAPSYSDANFWIASPSMTDTSDLVPPNANIQNDLSDKPVDVFFVHSTGYVGPGGWNSNMAHKNSETQSLQYMLSSMASAFNGCCEVYAPNYRQAHINAFIGDDTTSSFAALDLAYSDIERAFDYFIENMNKGRPFMIVGHSQGSLHALRLIAERIDNSALKERMVAAYTIGYWLPKDMFSRTFNNMSQCETAEQTACIVSFDSYGEGGIMANPVRQWYPSGWEITPVGNIACVNPLSWTTDTQRAPASLHKGAMPVEFKRTFVHMILAKNPEFIFQELPELTPQLTWAQCDASGISHVAQQQDNAFSNHLDSTDQSYHLLDYSLFYANIRQNAIVRSLSHTQGTASKSGN